MPGGNIFSTHELPLAVTNSLFLSRSPSNPNCNIRPGEDRDWGDRLQCSGVYTDLDDPEIGWGNKAQSFKCYRVR